MNECSFPGCGKLSEYNKAYCRDCKYHVYQRNKLIELRYEAKIIHPIINIADNQKTLCRI